MGEMGVKRTKPRRSPERELKEEGRRQRIGDSTREASIGLSIPSKILFKLNISLDKYILVLYLQQLQCIC